MAQFVPAKVNSPKEGGKDSSLGVLCPVESAREQLQGRPRRRMSGLGGGDEDGIRFRNVLGDKIEGWKSATAPAGIAALRSREA